MIDPRNRVVTVAFEIADLAKAAWIWEMLKARRDEQVADRGTWAYHVADGDAIRDGDHACEALDWLDDRSWGDSRFVDDVKEADLTLEAKKILLRNLDSKELADWLAAEEAKRLAAALAAPAPGQIELPLAKEKG